MKSICDCTHSLGTHSKDGRCQVPRCPCLAFHQPGAQPFRTAGYASRLEAERAAQLQDLERSGAITDLREQVDLFDTADGVTFRVDFAYREHGVLVYEDAKGIGSRSFFRKWADAQRRFPDARFRLSVRGRGGSIYVREMSAPIGLECTIGEEWA